MARREIDIGESRGPRNYEAEVTHLQGRLRLLNQAAEKNEALLKKTLERELELLQTDSLAGLIRVLVQDFAKSYAVDGVTLLLKDPQHEIRHLLTGSGLRLEDFPQVILVDSLSGIKPPLGFDCRPWLGPYSAIQHGGLFPGGRTIGSIAVIPLLRQQRLIGLLNFASLDPQRFTRQHSADFLAHLGVIAAICLENATNHARLLRSGVTDFLTGWHNRRYLQTRLKEELARAQRRSSSVACLMIDVDHFKEINDAFGHLGGDQVLRELAERMESCIRASDTAARFGGDEFAILLPDTTVADAALLAERLRQKTCAEPVDLGEGRIHMPSLSIGVGAIRPERNGRELNALADALLAEADAALYKAKNGGRGRVESAENP